MVTLTMPARLADHFHLGKLLLHLLHALLHLLGLFHQVPIPPLPNIVVSRLEIRHPAPGCGFIRPKWGQPKVFSTGDRPGMVFSAIQRLRGSMLSGEARRRNAAARIARWDPLQIG
jgi:hypothetical protein